MSYETSSGLAGRVVMVTGAGRNVGKALAVSLAQAGATVAVNDVDAAAADAVADQISTSGGRALAVAGDVTDQPAVRALVRHATAELGAIDILVNNAGVPTAGLAFGVFVESEPGDWRSVLELNVLGLMNCAKAVLPGMIQREWGRLITIGSDAGRFGEPLVAAYSAAKAGAAGFMRSIAREVGSFGITANTVSLGAIEDARVVGIDDDEDARGRRARRYPLGRLGRASDVAGAVIWLSSDGAEWVTGQTISINGGMVGAP